MSTANAFQSVNESKIEGKEFLEDSFRRFQEASDRLSEKYQLLRAETEQLRAQLREKDLEFRRAERLALLGQTAAAVAHEVRNPLGALRLYLSLLGRAVAGGSVAPEAHEYLQEMNKGIERIDGVVRNILHFAADKKLVFGPVNLQSLVMEQVELSTRPHGCRSAVSVVVKGNAFMSGNEAALRHVLGNLITNALQATKYKGPVTIEVVNDSLTGTSIVVQDAGPGIPQEIQATLFDPFVTTKSEGTGLGLAIVKQIVHQHGGVISVTNTPGARFEVKIPREKQQ